MALERLGETVAISHLNVIPVENFLHDFNLTMAGTSSTWSTMVSVIGLACSDAFRTGVVVVGHVLKDTTFEVSFDPPFVIAPTVVTLALKALDVNNSTNTRIDTDVTSVSSSGFSLHCKTWLDSQIFSLEVSWIAHTFAGGVFDSWAPS